MTIKEYNTLQAHGRVEHPERNKIVLEKNGRTVNLLSIGEALELRNSIRNVGIEVKNDRQPVRVSNIPENVSRFTIGDNTYRMYAL